MVTKINPNYDQTLPRSFNGKTVSAFQVTLSADTSGSVQPDGAFDAVIKTVSLRATPVMISAVASGTDFTVFLEGEFPTEAATLQADIQALGTVDSINLSTSTVAAGAVYQADQTNS